MHSTQYSTESIGNVEGKIWNLVIAHMKDLQALSTFKSQIKKFIYLFAFFKVDQTLQSIKN